MSILRPLGLGLLLALASIPAGRAAEPAPAMRVNEIVADTQRTSPDTDRVDLVWWLPPEFWMASLADDSTIPDKDREELVQLFRDNVVVGAVVAEMGGMGVEKFRDEATLRESIRLFDPQGHQYTPLPQANVDPQLKLMLQILKPMLANVIGPMGENLNFYVFPSKSKDGKPVADARGEGQMKVTIASTEYAFRLPLGSVLPPRFDTATGERFPGSYRFNPYTGAELTTGGAAQ